MKVTDLMVERAAPLTQGSRHVARAALEAALAPLPEPPSHLVLEELVGIADQHQDRAEAAEAKLAKVRSMKPARYRSVYVDFRDIEAILDKEP